MATELVHTALSLNKEFRKMSSKFYFNLKKNAIKGTSSREWYIRCLYDSKSLKIGSRKGFLTAQQLDEGLLPACLEAPLDQF